MKRGLVTGATSGIGKEYARALAAMGYNLVITGRRREYIEEVKNELERLYKVEVEVVIVDFGMEEHFAEFLDKIRNMKIDFIVNNAGYGNDRDFLKMDFEDMEKMVDVHINAGMKIIRSLLPNMSRGTIVNVSSLASFTPTSYNSLYGGTKAFINFFTEALYIRLRKDGFRVQLLLPSFTYTDFHKRQGIPEEKLKNKAFIKWMDAREVVEYSIKSLNKKGCLCIPGRINRVLFFMFRFIPRSFYYKIIEKDKGL